MKEVVIDTDPGIDDSLAIIYAAQKAKIEAITTVAGNAEQEKVLRNANYLKEKIGLDSKVYTGSKGPIKKELQTASSHGESGLGNVIPGSKYEKSSGDAVEKIISSADSGKELLTLGPLTNLARALERDPDVLQKYGSVTIMGGAIKTYGNISRRAEFNFWTDPEAADRVLSAKGEKRIVPVNICRKTTLKLEFLEELGKDLKEMVKPYIEYYRDSKGMKGGLMYDPLAAGLCLNPSIGKTTEMDLRVETDGKYTRGMTVPEERGDKKQPNSKVFRQVSSERFLEDFKDSLKSFEKNRPKGRENDADQP